MSVVCVNAVSNQAFWRTPDALAGEMAARLPPGWELVVARALPELSPALRRARIVLGWPFPAAMARGARELRWVHFFTAGIPESWRSAPKDVRVTSQRDPAAPGVDRSVAEHALFLLMAALRGATAESFEVSAAPGATDAFFVPRAAGAMRAAIFGHGAIGRALAPLLAPLFAEVVVVARRAPAEALPDGVRFEPMEAWERVASASDVVVLAVPLTPETRALFGPGFFAALRPRSIVVNVASGALVAEADVLAFLARDPERRYVADVAHPEPYPADGALLQQAQVLLTPHVGARREDAWSAIGARALQVLDEATRATREG